MEIREKIETLPCEFDIYKTQTDKLRWDKSRWNVNVCY